MTIQVHIFSDDPSTASSHPAEMLYQFGLSDESEGHVLLNSTELTITTDSTNPSVLEALNHFQHSRIHELKDEYESFYLNGACYARKYRSMPSFINSLQYLSMLYIEAASYIDYNDDKWILYTLHSKATNELIGFCTLYRFFKFPQGIRARVSQFLILPNHQRKGYGSLLYSFIVSELSKDTDVKELTVESPADAFVKMKIRSDSALLSTGSERILSRRDRQVALEYRTVKSNKLDAGVKKAIRRRLLSQYEDELPVDKSEREVAISLLVNNEIEFLKTI